MTPETEIDPARTALLVMDYQNGIMGRIADLCADPEPGIHDFLVERIFPRQAEVIDRGELHARLS